MYIIIIIRMLYSPRTTEWNRLILNIYIKNSCGQCFLLFKKYICHSLLKLEFCSAKLSNSKVHRASYLLRNKEGPKQRIFIIWERTAIPFVFTKVPLSPRKPETVRKSTPEPLSAVLINTELEGGGGRVGECTLLYFISLLCTLYSRLGQIIF